MIKAFVSILILFMQFPLEVYSQKYNPTIGNSNKWNIVETFEATGTKTYIADRDTIISGFTYKIYELTSDIRDIAYIREDTVSRKIFVRPGEFVQDTNEYVLYDFSLSELDSLPLYAFSYWGIDNLGYFQIDSIREIEILEGITRVFHLHENENTSPVWHRLPVWIEGCGSIGDFIHPGVSAIDHMWGELSCFFRNEIQVYQSPKYDSCMIFVDGIQSPERTDFLGAYPNPFQNSIHLYSEIPQNVGIRIINSSGQIVYLNPLIEITENEVDLSTVPDGVLILQIFGEKLRMNTILIKQTDR